MRKFRSLIRRIKPRILLLIDAIGAFSTFGFTAFLLAPAWIPTGLPTEALVTLAVAAFGLFMTSLSGYQYSADPRLRLRLVAILNTVYCLATIGLCCIHFATLTIWAATYFGIEVPIVLGLAWLEWRVSFSTDTVERA